MKSKVFYLLLSALMLTSCFKHEMPNNNEVTKEQIKENVQFVFGTTFDSEHDWCTTTSGEITVNGIPTDVERVKLFAYITEEDGETSILSLNECEVNGNGSVKLTFDAPYNNLGLYVAFISNTNIAVMKVESNVVSFNSAARTRAITTEYTLPSVTPTIGTIEDSYAAQRGWINGEKLYGATDYASLKMATRDYSDEFKNVFRVVIFSYFKNGRAYDNLPLVKESGFYNEKCYPFTTGDEPILITPVYKRDGAKTYGNEVYNSDLYYYYFKEENVGTNPQAYFESLPKYKAIPFNECFSDNEDDVIEKKGTYALIYWGDGTPTEGTTGTFQFPEGYKIGFMVRAKTEYKENGKPRKQGELYGDGRLNNKINNYSECNFKSSKLGTDGPRAAWITVNGKMLLCFESGTDKDFNDIILEVEGGVEPIINIPDIENNFYTFCFEDTELGDYDMNDIVIKARRLNTTQVEYRIVACGAYDELKVMGINGNIINGNTEVHRMFGLDGGYINTSSQNAEPVVDVIKVDSKFSFLNEGTQPYVYDITTGKTIRLSKKGEDPHGIMIPYDFRYPKEKICIKNAYSKFNNWGQNRITSTDWYIYPNEGMVF